MEERERREDRGRVNGSEVGTVRTGGGEAACNGGVWSPPCVSTLAANSAHMFTSMQTACPYGTRGDLARGTTSKQIMRTHTVPTVPII